MAPIACPSQQLSPVQSNMAFALTTSQQQHDFPSFSEHFSQPVIGSTPVQSDIAISYGSNSQYFVCAPQMYQTPAVPTTMIHYVPSSATTAVAASGDLSGRTSGIFFYVPTSYAPTVDLTPKYSPLLPAAWTSVPVPGATAVPVITSAVSGATSVLDYATASNTCGGVGVVAPGSAACPEALTTMYPTAADYQHEQQLVPVMLLQNQHQEQAQPSVKTVAPPRVTGTGLTAVKSAGNPFINTTNMQQVWHGAFDQHFYSYLAQHGDLWQLAPVSSPEESESIVGLPGVKTINDSAKVRFLCKGCGNPWTSMKGKVIFWISLERHPESAKTPYTGIIGNGTVRFKLFGQRCQKCSSESYENAMWYPEEVVKVIKNLFFRVGQTYYGFKAPAADITRRPGRPRTQHNSSFCQACAEGICHENNVR